MQQKTVFDRYLRNWRNTNNRNIASTMATNDKNESDTVIRGASTGIMLIRAMTKIRDISLHRLVTKCFKFDEM